MIMIPIPISEILLAACSSSSPNLDPGFPTVQGTVFLVGMAIMLVAFRVTPEQPLVNAGKLMT